LEKLKKCLKLRTKHKISLNSISFLLEIYKIGVNYKYKLLNINVKNAFTAITNYL